MFLKSSFAIVLFASLIGSDDPKPVADTRVALIPVLNISGETWEEAKSKQSDRGNEELRALFTERSFQVIERPQVEAALKKLNVDLTDEEQHRREVFYQVGEEVKADLIAFVLITDVDQRKVAKFLVTSTEGKAKMKACT